MIIAIVQFSHHPCVIREEKTNLLHPAQRPKTKHEAQTLPKMETCSSNSHHIKVMIPMTLGLNLASTKRMRRNVPSVVEGSSSAAYIDVQRREAVQSKDFGCSVGRW